ncbi:DMT family transporter [Streptococcus halichoeri]|uniref:DMT family transporter n=1 Tax=Streptococcus halichoeri TaxID=254785 RepID=UPI0013573AC0|nr:DMT family transporter [Streptococcus halichoeri]
MKHKGTILVLLAGTAWGLSGVAGQYLLSQNINVNLLTALRLLISGLFLLGLAIATQKERLKAILQQKKAVLQLLLFSFCGLLLNQYAYLNAIKFTDAGTATVLQYLNPVLILAFVSLAEKRYPSIAEGSSIFLALVGTIVIATHGNLSELAVTPQGLAWGLISAVAAALYVLLPVRLIQDWGSLVVIGLAMVISGSTFTLLTRAWHYKLALTLSNSLALFGLVVIGTIVAYTFFLVGTSMVGPIKATLLAAIEPIASVFLAFILLGQEFFYQDLLGMLLILIAVLLISIRDIYLLRREKRFATKDEMSHRANSSKMNT